MGGTGKNLQDGEAKKIEPGEKGVVWTKVGPWGVVNRTIIMVDLAGPKKDYTTFYRQNEDNSITVLSREQYEEEIRLNSGISNSQD